MPFNIDAKTYTKWAKQGPKTAKERLISGKALNWLSDDLGGSLCWAVEAWLLLNKPLRSDRGGGFPEMWKYFINNAPKGLVAKTMSCHSKIFFLNARLGYEDYDIEPLPINEWKLKAQECIAETETIISLLLGEDQLPKTP